MVQTSIVHWKNFSLTGRVMPVASRAMKQYARGRHTVYHYRYHIRWITKYRYRVLNDLMKERIRQLVAQVAEELSVEIENGVVSSDHVHVFVAIPLNVLVSEFVKQAKGGSVRKVQQEFPELRKCY
jgi:putative transposase